MTAPSGAPSAGRDDATYLHPILRTWIWALPRPRGGRSARCAAGSSHHRPRRQAPDADPVRPGLRAGGIDGPNPTAAVTLESDAARRVLAGALPDPGSVEREGPDPITPRSSPPAESSPDSNRPQHRSSSGRWALSASSAPVVR